MARRPKTPKWLAARKAASSAGAAKAPADWLARALSRAGVVAPRSVAELLEGRHVRVQGKVVTEGFSPLFAGDRVEVKGRPVDLSPTTVVLVFHKPKGLVVAGDDREGPGTVFEALEARLPPELQGYGWHAVGRLDRDTTGLLLFTNDEQFVGFATSPETHLAKRYLVTVGGTVTPEKLERLQGGLTLDGYTTRPAKASLRPDGRLELVLTEGKYHQVKHMVNAVGLGTVALHREAVGDLVLDIPEGELRRLTDEEVATRLHYVPRHLRGADGAEDEPSSGSSTP